MPPKKRVAGRPAKNASPTNPKVSATPKARIPATPRAQTSPNHVPEEEDDDDEEAVGNEESKLDVITHETPSSITTARGKKIEASATSSRSKRGSNALMLPPEIPAKKGKAAAAAATKEDKSVPEPTSMIEKDVKRKGRPARSKANEIIEEAAKTLLEPETVEPVQTEAEEPPKKRGRPAKGAKGTAATQPESESKVTKEAAPAPAKKRGRPATQPQPEVDEEAAPEPSRKRGRPAKQSEPESNVEEEIAPAPAKKRGRPAKQSKPESEVAEETVPKSTKRRGRPSEQTEPASEPEAVEEPASEPPKKRGRPAKQPQPEIIEEAAPAPAKKRGRPTKQTQPEADEEATSEPPKKRGRPAKQPQLEADEEAAPEPPKKRGRPAKHTKSEAEDDAPEESVAEEKSAKKTRGRPARKPAAAKEPENKIAKPRGKVGRPRKAEEPAHEESTDAEILAAEAAAPKRARGRPASNIVVEESDKAPAPAAKKRGRPARKSEPAPEEEEEEEEEELAEAALDSPAQNKAKGKKSAAAKRKASAAPARGRPAKNAKKNVQTSEEEEDTEIADDGSPNYWLMKAEPNTRIEKNADGEDVDVRFSIDDLQSKTQPEPWEGIRNPQAQKNLKAMKKGELVFFYESNCKLPGIVGVMEVVEEASPDNAQFDRKSAYFDEKSNPEEPRWMLVHVQLKRKFSGKIGLKELQKFSKAGGALENMALLKQTRLSVSKVSKPEWDFVMNRAGEEQEDEAMEDGQGTEKEVAPEDLGNDFATAFEAPANFSVPEEKDEADQESPAPDNEVEVPAIQDHDNTTAGAGEDADTTMADVPVPATDDDENIPFSEPAAVDENDASRSGGFLQTISSAIGSAIGQTGSPLSRGRSGTPILTTATDATINAAESAQETVENVIESVEHVAGTVVEMVEHAVESAAGTIANAATSILPSPLQQEEAKEEIKEVVAKASSRAPSVRASSRAPSRARSATARSGNATAATGRLSTGSAAGAVRRAVSKARSTARDTISSVDNAFKAQTDTIFEGDDGEENEIALSDLKSIETFNDPVSGAQEGGAPVAVMSSISGIEDNGREEDESVGF